MLVHIFFYPGVVVKVCPIKHSERYGKLCKLVLKEDVEKVTRPFQQDIMNVFLLGDVADEGGIICEGDRVVLSEVIAECSPTDEHHFQLIVWREKSQASIWIISERGKVRANMVNGVKLLRGSFEDESIVQNSTATENCAVSEEEEQVIYESCEYDFTQQTGANEPQRVGEKRKEKFQLGPKGVTPSDVKRKFVSLNKTEVKQLEKTLEQEESHTESTSTRANVSAAVGANTANENTSAGNTANIALPSIAVETAGQSMVMSQNTTSGGNGQSLSVCVQSANPTAEQPCNVQCTHIELTPSGVSTRIWNGQSSALQSRQLRDPSQFGVMPLRDLPQLSVALDNQGYSQSTVAGSNLAASVESANTAGRAEAATEAGPTVIAETMMETEATTGSRKDGEPKLGSM